MHACSYSQMEGIAVTVRLLVGDVRERIREIPDGSIDLLATSPPFLALRKYGENSAEMGSERTPADFLDALLELTQEFRRVLAPHGSIAIELGDTYSGSGGAGGDYGEGGLRDGQESFTGSAVRARAIKRAAIGGAVTHEDAARPGTKSRLASGAGWPLAKSLTLIPTLYPASLAYGRNLLRLPPSAEQMLQIARDWVINNNGTAADLVAFLDAWHDQITDGKLMVFAPWRVRNVIVWARPNPPVGALGDKVRPATSYITIGCTSAKRWFDLDAVRTPLTRPEFAKYEPITNRVGPGRAEDGAKRSSRGDIEAGAPPLDWWEDDDPTGHATLVLPTQPYPGAHYATWPEALAARLIKMMCPLRVCTTCGEPSRRITRTLNAVGHAVQRRAHFANPDGAGDGRRDVPDVNTAPDRAIVETLGWSDCGHGDTWRPGRVLDPFAGSGTTLAVAQGLGRDAIGIELYEANADLVRERVGMFLSVDEGAA